MRFSKIVFITECREWPSTPDICGLSWPIYSGYEICAITIRHLLNGCSFSFPQNVLSSITPTKSQRAQLDYRNRRNLKKQKNKNKNTADLSSTLLRWAQTGYCNVSLLHTLEFRWRWHSNCSCQNRRDKQENYL